MNIVDKNIEYIKSDIEIVKNRLSGKISKIGLFGSSLEQEFQEANDIDIVLYCSEPYEEVRRELLELDLGFPICPHKMNGTYGFKENDRPDKHYHIILLDQQHPNIEFERINNGKIHFL